MFVLFSAQLVCVQVSQQEQFAFDSLRNQT